MSQLKVKKCPIAIVSERTSILKKWTLTIIRDLIFDYDRFTDFLNNNPSLSAKVLSERLKEMEDDGLIIKKIISTRPMKIRYKLTQMGRELNKILYEFSMFGGKHFTQEVFNKEYVSEQDCIDTFGPRFKLQPDYLDYLKAPSVKKVSVVE